MRLYIHAVLFVLLGAGLPVWSQTTELPAPLRLPPVPPRQTDAAPERRGHELGDHELRDHEQAAAQQAQSTPLQIADTASLEPLAEWADASDETLSTETDIRFAFDRFAELRGGVQRIPTTVEVSASTHRIVRYEIPLDDWPTHQAFRERGIDGRLIEVVDQSARDDQSFSDRIRAFMSPGESKPPTIRKVRYDVSADDIQFHAELVDVDSQLLERGLIRLPEVRFFQPKARVFMDLKRGNDGEFDLFNNGAILASLDVIELYFPMPLVSARFAEVFGRPDRLSALGWRVGGTLGLGITTALNNGTAENGSAPVSTLSSGIRYEFPLGRPSRELLDTGDPRLDQRTRVGMELGIQGGVSTRESLDDATDVGLYFGILVNTPWGS